MQKINLPITGMHCRSCELLIEKHLKKVAGVMRAEASQSKGSAKVWFQGQRPSMYRLSSAVEEAGYSIGHENSKFWLSRNPRDYLHLFYAAWVIGAIIFAATLLGLNSSSIGLGVNSILMAGMLGLVAGVSSCMALVGGLVLALSARHAEVHPEASAMQKFRPHLFFNLGRVLGFAVLGGLIGLVGSAAQPSIKTLSFLTIGVGIVMVLLGLKLIEIFPILHKVNITLPKSLSRLLGMGQEAKEYSHWGAFIGGAASFFLPCGFTQAMQLYAISTGSFVQGSLIMSLFALGTAPGLLGVGGLAAAFKGSKAKVFFATAGLTVVLLGLYNISNASRIAFPSNDSVLVSAESVKDSDELQVVNTTYRTRSDIVPNEFTVKAGKPVKFMVDVRDEGSGCMSTIMIPGLYNTPLFLEKDKQLALEFTPAKAGRYPITCAMGVKRGVLNVE